MGYILCPHCSQKTDIKYVAVCRRVQTWINPTDTFIGPDMILEFSLEEVVIDEIYHYHYECVKCGEIICSGKMGLNKYYKED